MKHVFLSQDNNLIEDVLQQAPWGIVLCSVSGEIRVANQAAASILSVHLGRDYSDADLLGQPITRLIAGLDLRVLGEQRVGFADRKSSTLHVQLSQLEGDRESFLAVYIESPHRCLERERLLEHQASTDELSDLSNRRAFQRSIEARQDRALSLALIDVDHFKNVNDKHGHLVGDDLIQLIGRFLKEHFSGPSDLASRMGGDEFSVLTETSTPDEFVAQVQKFCEQLSSTKVPGTVDLYATVSCGAVVSLVPDIDCRTLLTIADQELYKAKASGRNTLSWGLLKP